MQGKTMKKVNFEKAYYLKLGRGNKWAENSISNNLIRIGWANQRVGDISNGNWEIIKKQLLSETGNQGVATRDLNALKNIVSEENIVFITFYGSKMYWCRPLKGSISSDKISKYLKVDGKWHCTDITEKTVFYVNQISGKLSKYQGFRATCCQVGNQFDELNHLKRLINNEKSDEYSDMIDHRTKLCQIVEKQIQQLHPKDFEILIDLIFRQAGWRRQSVLGETMEFFDLILEEVISNMVYGIQIKTKSSRKEFFKYVEEYNEKYFEEYDKFIYIVHSPDSNLEKYVNPYDNIELWDTQKLSNLVLEFGLMNWILKKIK